VRSTAFALRARRGGIRWFPSFFCPRTPPSSGGRGMLRSSIFHSFADRRYKLAFATVRRSMSSRVYLERQPPRAGPDLFDIGVREVSEREQKVGGGFFLLHGN